MRQFLNKHWAGSGVAGLRSRCPPKTIAEHAATQAEFLDNTLQPLLKKARAQDCQVFCVDAAHFVQGAFRRCLWCQRRLFIRGASGRQRYSVLGAWNAVTNSLVSITTASTMSSNSMCELLRKIATLGWKRPITLVLDNARYQHCTLVMNLAATLNMRLALQPSYSPNLNLIERLWKFIKRDVLYSRHYNTFADFRAAINGSLANIPTKHREKIQSLMTHRFQQFNPASFLAA